ncbi:hypothetical protein KR767_18840 [Luteibacter anthropi]|uniref:hypothetical protein n=1 Tax=Luteibacter anthropi TaxID=564369 RepID=UPI0020323201|nr:hypothetical protein [Luteibacter anthropi]URX62078.1 hypothetical protein KR767_18840 [Luteibacter anthropi]
MPERVGYVSRSTTVYGFSAFLRLHRDGRGEVQEADVVNEQGICFHTLRLPHDLMTASCTLSNDDLLDRIEQWVTSMAEP